MASKFQKSGAAGLVMKVGDNSVLADAGTFGTGSRGYLATGKIVHDGKRYQITANIVEIGSKPKDTGVQGASTSAPVVEQKAKRPTPTK